MGTEKNYILSKEVAEKKLRRMAYEILENNIDDNKPRIYKKMHDGDQRIFEHLLLPECQQQYIFPSLRFIVTKIFVTTEFYIAADLFYFFCKKPDRNNRNKHK